MINNSLAVLFRQLVDLTWPMPKSCCVTIRAFPMEKIYPIVSNFTFLSFLLMLGHLSGQYRATLAPILFNPAGCSQIMGFSSGGAYFCGLWETCNSFFFFNAKPFIALGDVKSTGCLQQCHVTKGLPTWSLWDTAEPEPHPSLHPPTLHIPCSHLPSGWVAACRAFYFFFCLWFRGFNYRPGFLFIERAIVWCSAFIHP